PFPSSPTACHLRRLQNRDRSCSFTQSSQSIVNRQLSVHYHCNQRIFCAPCDGRTHRLLLRTLTAPWCHLCPPPTGEHHSRQLFGHHLRAHWVHRTLLCTGTGNPKPCKLASY